jgi:hypothetical protein
LEGGVGGSSGGLGSSVGATGSVTLTGGVGLIGLLGGGTVTSGGLWNKVEQALKASMKKNNRGGCVRMIERAAAAGLHLGIIMNWNVADGQGCSEHPAKNLGL